MLSHGNLAWTASAAGSVFQSQPDDCCVASLPLSHIAEQMFTIHIPPVTGHKVLRQQLVHMRPSRLSYVILSLQVYFCESLEKLVPTLAEIQPTLLFSPPRYSICFGMNQLLTRGSRIYEKLNAALATKLPPGAKPEQLPDEAKKGMIKAVGLSRGKLCALAMR